MSDLDGQKAELPESLPQENDAANVVEPQVEAEPIAEGKSVLTGEVEQDAGRPANAPQRGEAPAVVPTSRVEKPTVAVVTPMAAAAPAGAQAMPPEADDNLVEQRMHRMSRRSFLWGATAVVAGFAGLRWLDRQATDDGTIWPLRRVLQFNEGLARGYFQDSRLAPTFPRAQAQTPRANGDIGLNSDFDAATWKLYVVGLADTAQARTVALPVPQVVDSDDPTPLPVTQELAVALDMAAIKALPRVEMVTELKCIEGWSTIVHWAGARFADFMAHYAPKMENGKLPQYVGMQTPDGRYFVGMDMASAMHPQTLLCYEMNGAPLTADHGAPLRLVTPVKYGIKHIKRIGAIRFTNERPIDYWAKLGYDWYAGH